MRSTRTTGAAERQATAALGPLPESAQEKIRNEMAGAVYACFVDDQPVGSCVLDYGMDSACTYAVKRRRRETCPFWRLKVAVRPPAPLPPTPADMIERTPPPEAVRQVFEIACRAAYSFRPMGYEGCERRYGAEKVCRDLWKSLRSAGFDIEWPEDMKYLPP